MAVSQNPPSSTPNTKNEEQEMENNKPDSPQQLPILSNSSSPSKNNQSSGLVYVQIFKYISETLTKMEVSQNPPSSKPNTHDEEQEMENNKPDSPQQPPILHNSSSPSKKIQSSEVEKGKYCHQCRQRTMKFETCKNHRNNKPCAFKFCEKCLFNRYGEKAEEVALLDDWKCPKCRDICNCSCCMKRKGSQPTGPLIHTAKATGFSSVSEMLIAKLPEDLISWMSAKDELVVAELMSSPLEMTDLPTQISYIIYPDLVNKEERIDEENNSLPACDDEVPEAHIPCSQGINLTTVAGIDLPSEDVRSLI